MTDREHAHKLLHIYLEQLKPFIPETEHANLMQKIEGIEKYSRNSTSADTSLNQAVERSLQGNHIAFAYQPIVEAETAQPVSFETYSRLWDEEAGLMMPDEFLKIARTKSLLPQLDLMAARRLLARHSETPMPLSLNLSGESTRMGDDFTENLVDILVEHPYAPGLVTFEMRLGELENPASANAFVNEAAKIGYGFAIDYFGGGRATLDVYKHIGFGTVKLAASRMERALTDAAYRANLQQLIDHSCQLDLKMVVEKVESEAVYSLCLDMGVPYVQGYYVAKPKHNIQAVLTPIPGTADGEPE